MNKVLKRQLYSTASKGTIIENTNELVMYRYEDFIIALSANDNSTAIVFDASKKFETENPDMRMVNILNKSTPIGNHFFSRIDGVLHYNYKTFIPVNPENKRETRIILQYIERFMFLGFEFLCNATEENILKLQKEYEEKTKEKIF